MVFYDTVETPFGELTITSDGTSLTALSFETQRWPCIPQDDEGMLQAPDDPVLRTTREWLGAYFENPGVDPGPIPPVNPAGSDFRKAVCQIMAEIPYGELTTYGEIAHELVRRGVIKRPSARAVGGAVGHNPIGIIIPCHRVIGSGGNLTGYGGGMDRKVYLLKHEGVSFEGLKIPTKGTAIYV